MSKKNFIVFILIMTVFGFAFAISDFCDIQIVNSNSVTTLGLGDLRNSELSIVKGSILKIILEENSSTGFSWVLDDGFEGIFSIRDDVGINIFTDSENMTMVGAPGKRVFAFQSLDTGDAVFNFKYMRPWDPNSCDRTISIRVSVTETPELLPVVNLSAVTDENRVGLEWDYYGEYDYFKIYRKRPVGEFNYRFYAATDEKKFYDTNFAREGEVEYGVSTVKDGYESDITYVKVLLQF